MQVSPITIYHLYGNLHDYIVKIQDLDIALYVPLELSPHFPLNQIFTYNFLTLFCHTLSLLKLFIPYSNCIRNYHCTCTLTKFDIVTRKSRLITKTRGWGPAKWCSFVSSWSAVWKPGKQWSQPLRCLNTLISWKN